MSPEFHHILLIEYSTTYAKIIRDIFAESQDPVYTVSCTGSVAEGGIEATITMPFEPDGTAGAEENGETTPDVVSAAHARADR